MYILIYIYIYIYIFYKYIFIYYVYICFCHIRAIYLLLYFCYIVATLLQYVLKDPVVIVFCSTNVWLQSRTAHRPEPAKSNNCLFASDVLCFSYDFVVKVLV